MNEHMPASPKAVIPAAGLGTRFLPVTRAVPKPLLPVLAIPLIDYAVTEAAVAGIGEILLVISPGHEAIARYFEHHPRLEPMLNRDSKTMESAQQPSVVNFPKISFVYQEEALGLGHAVLMAREFVGDDPFAVLLPDDIFWSADPAIAQVANVHSQVGGMVIAAKCVPEERISSLGIIESYPVSDRVHKVKGLIEKPPIDNAPSNLAIIGRYVLGPEVFRHLLEGNKGAVGEIQLTDAVAATIGTVPVHAIEIIGEHADAGTPSGMLVAALAEARSDITLRALVQRTVASW
jgi:UTP-glucose-1-phosphate uridylyltransferase